MGLTHRGPAAGLSEAALKAVPEPNSSSDLKGDEYLGS